MMQKLLITTVFLFISSVVFAGGQADADADYLSRGMEFYNEGKTAEALAEFKKAAISEDEKTAAAGYYNHGTLSAELAEEVQEPAEKRKLLEESYDSLKRAAELDRLPEVQQKNVRRNMEVVRKQLSQLPEPPPDGQQQDGQQQDGQQQDGQQQDGQQQDGQQQNSESGLEKQQELRRRTESGEGDLQELAGEQKALQKESEAAEQNEAALSQARAAEALKQGDREEAAEYQKTAERQLAAAEDDDADGEAGGEAGGEAEDILNQEAEYEAMKNRLDKTGGITDVDRNW